MAGLSAARTLAEAGRRVCLLESQPRVGGRILTERHGDHVVELGAEFIHGRPPQLWQLIHEAGLRPVERTGAMMQSQDGQLADAGWAEDDDPQDPLETLKTFPGPDCSFADYADRLHLAGDARASAIGYVEGFNAADAREASAMALGRQQTAEDAIEGTLSWRLHEGYDRLPTFLLERFQAAGGTLHRNTPVQSIRWQPGSVTVETSAGPFHAPQAVITLPLGVLQARSVRFEPDPAAILEAASRMRMGQVFRITLAFKRRLWPQRMGFLFTRDSLPSVWWPSDPVSADAAQPASITGWLGGPRSADLLRLPSAERLETVLATLGQALGTSAAALRAQLTHQAFHDWQADPNALGAYSWVPVGGLEASATMAQPVQDTLYFAGEHTDLTGHWGTVHAALGSGLRAAQNILKHAQTPVA